MKQGYFFTIFSAFLQAAFFINQNTTIWFGSVIEYQYKILELNQLKLGRIYLLGRGDCAWKLFPILPRKKNDTALAICKGKKCFVF